MANWYTYDHLRKVKEHPEILSRLCGKDKATALHGEWIKYIWDDTLREKVLFAHRGSMKTTNITEVGSIYRMMFFPDQRIFIFRKTFTEAAANIRNIQNMMMIPEVNELLRLAWFGPNSKEKWEFTSSKEGSFNLSVKQTRTKEPSISGYGIESGITGLHAESILCDDTVTLKDRVSEADRERTKIIIQELRANIIDKPYCVQFLGTPWFITKGEGGDAYSMLPPARKYPASATGLLTLEQIEEVKKKTTKVFYNLNYELCSTDAEDQPFQNPMRGKVEWDKIKNIQAHIDAAYGGEDSCALTLMGQRDDDKIAAIGWRYAGNIKEWIPFILQKLKQYRPRRLHAETNSDRGFVLDLLKIQPEFKEAHTWAMPYHEDMHKEVKIGTYLKESWEDIMWDDNTDDNYLNEIMDWVDTAKLHDDCPDSAASLLRQGSYSSTKHSYKKFLAAWKW